MSVKKNLIPLSKKILVRRDEVQKNKGAILLPDAAQEKPRQGKVLYVGEGVPDCVYKDDTVLFNHYAGVEVDFNDEKLLILKYKDLLAVVR